MSWKSFFGRFTIWALAANLLMLFLLVLIDPYGTGRLTFIPSYDIPAYGQRMANASRASNSTFDSAIIGNSTIQLLSPARLDPLTGHRFVNLSIPGTGPYEQLAVLSLFLRKHAGRSGPVIIGIDQSWCGSDIDFNPDKTAHPFPFWLYDAPLTEYIAELYSFKSIERSGRRIGVLLGLRQPAPYDGFDDYEAGRVYDPVTAQQRLTEAPREGANSKVLPERRDYPQFDRLVSLLEKRPTAASPVLVFLPYYWPAMSEERKENILACKAKAHEVARDHPDMHIADFLIDSDITRAADNFWDDEHYRGEVAQRIERDLAKRMISGRDAIAMPRDGFFF